MPSNDLSSRLHALADPAYRLFQCKLMPTVPTEQVWGVRTPQLRALAKETAARRGIPAQDKRAVAGGTDAGPIHTACGGVPCLTMAAPCRYIHSPASLCRLSDIDALGALTLALLEEIGGNPA